MENLAGVFFYALYVSGDCINVFEKKLEVIKEARGRARVRLAPPDATLKHIV
jgi:hypothetical protein